MTLPNTSVITIERFIMDRERQIPEATGELSNLLYDIALGSKIIASAVRRAGIINILGSAHAINIQGEEQQKLDVFANEALQITRQHVDLNINSRAARVLADHRHSLRVRDDVDLEFRRADRVDREADPVDGDRSFRRDVPR